jgi:Xaa-Pro aminopeptidase
MTTSNEPGYYEDGNFGIRIENLCITVPIPTPFNFMNGRYVGFETVTMTPIALNMVDLSKLTTKEIVWLNEYHSKVRAVLAPLMEEHFPEAAAYLVERTEPIVV